jgi:hypothetical protein
MRMNTRYAALRLLGLLLLATALAGCSIAPHYEKGALLTTEQREVGRTPEYKLQGVDHLDRVPPVLVVWMDTRDRITTEQRDMYQKVEVSGRRRLAFEPTFLLWPWNVVRTPVGLVGCVFSGVDLGLHYVAAGGGAVAGVAASVFTYIALNACTLFQVGDLWDTTGFGLAADFAQLFIFVLETPLLVLDVPHKAIHGTPIYPVAMNRKEFPQDWGAALGGSWHYAWDYKAYPPFIIWPRAEEERVDLPGETLAGGWARSDTYGDWRQAQPESFTLEAGGRTSSVPALAGMASVNLRELAAGLGPRDTLRLKVTAQTPQGPVSGDFTFPVADLLPAP